MLYAQSNPLQQQQPPTYYHALDPQSRAGSVSYDPSMPSPSDLMRSTFSPGQCATVELGGGLGKSPPVPASRSYTGGSSSAAAASSALVAAASAAAAGYPMLPPLPSSSAAAAGVSPAAANEYAWFSSPGSVNSPSGAATFADQQHATAMQQYQYQHQQQHQRQQQQFSNKYTSSRCSNKSISVGIPRTAVDNTDLYSCRLSSVRPSFPGSQELVDRANYTMLRLIHPYPHIPL
ncbi:hypothetical protein BCR44DRAFT_1280531 [Catenaria anguillulae PL171]|uniref:Uncharacterized protein n=1 Tax=Catenaria anguillulae PL171 TaxID=765915 RepID=A0A1Y2HAM0_9FUNG|nr:hypothetical protein BCR44DRAFT_1280531 [Catenaria anguillulae PL171]